MKKSTLLILNLLFLVPVSGITQPKVPDFPKKVTSGISGLYYDNITTTSVRLTWKTIATGDSKVQWMVSDSNDQPVIYKDSAYSATLGTSHEIQVENLSPATMYRYLATSSNGLTTDSATGYFITKSASSGKVTVWFNHTVDTTVANGKYANGKADFQKLIKSQIDKAVHSIDITTWEFDELDSVAAYLVRAKDRGVRIRFVYNHMPDSRQIDTLKAHGIKIVKRTFDTTYTMHNKFWVFDHRDNSDPSTQYLWTGSTNITHTQFHSDRNNIIIIQDQSLCEVYTREFEEMWGSHGDEPDLTKSRFGIQKTDNLAHILNVGGIKMEAFFAPTDSITDTLTYLFNTYPLKSVYFSMLKFVLPGVESALHEAMLRSIQISGVFDSSCSVKKGSAFPRMKGENVPGAWQPPADVFIDTIPGLIHHKYSVINADTSAGEKITTTGSFNWELPAQQGNDENMLVIWDATINNLYFQEFMARYRESGGVALGSGWGTGPDMEVPAGITLKCSPNPFTGKTFIDLHVIKEQDIRLTLYDVTGRKLLTLADKTIGPGIHSVEVDGKFLPAGMLICKAEMGNKTLISKLIHYNSD